MVQVSSLNENTFFMRKHTRLKKKSMAWYHNVLMGRLDVSMTACVFVRVCGRSYPPVLVITATCVSITVCVMLIL